MSPFELLAALNIHQAASLSQAEARLADEKIVCLPLPLLSPGLDQLLSLRLRLGVRNSGHTLSKLIDPCIGRSVRVVAVTHPPYLVSMEALLVAEQGRALLMRGTEGEAYAAPRRQPRMLGLVDGRPQVMFEQAHQDTFEEPEQGCSVTENAELITQMLAGQVAVPQSIANQVAALSELAQDH